MPLQFVLQMSLALCLGLFLTACQKSGDSRPTGDQPRVYTGDLEILYHDLQTGEHYWQHEICDKPFYAIQMEIASELERRKGELEKFDDNSSSEGPQPEKKVIGPLTVWTRPKVDARNEWSKDDVWGWKDIIEHYQSIKGTATDVQWQHLNTDVRGIAPDDEDRIKYGDNLQVQRQDQAFLGEMTDALQKCLADPTCNALPEPVFSKAEKNEIYRFFNSYWKRNQDDKKWVIEAYIRRVARDNKNRFDLIPKGLEVDLVTETLTVRMNAGEFSEKAQQLEDYFLKPWNEAGLKVKIEWLTARVAEAFDILISPLGSRAYVSVSKDLKSKEMSLAKKSWSSTLTHEFGHVLGLRDEYYTMWDDTACGYYTEYNNGNIMSRSATGSILPEHVESIKLLHFPKRLQE
jgi:hypothetical protein